MTHNKMKRKACAARATSSPTGSRQSPPTRPATFRQLEVCVEPSAPPSWPSISACIIAKNEASNLPACIHSLADLPSEIIVVDTGSTDNTPYIARSLGALVFHFPWIDDFSAARNHSLHHASKQWIFWLDADDRLSPKAVAQLKRAAASDIADAYMCLVRSQESDGRTSTTEHVRLFRNGLGICFVGAIHESPLPEIARLGLRLARTDIVIDHVGYMSADAVRAKAARNLAIIDREIVLHPDRTELLFFRGHSRSTAGDMDGAEADMRRYLASTSPSPTFDHMRFWAYSVLARIAQIRGLLDEAGRLLTSALAEFPNHPHFLHLQGVLKLRLGQPEEAVNALKAALHSLDGNVLGFQPPRIWIEMKLAEGYKALGQTAEAMRYAEQARCHGADTGDSRMPLMSLDMGPNATADLATSILASTVLSKTKTQATSSQPLLQAQLRGLALLVQGEQMKAAEWFAQAIQAAPTDPDNYRYLAVALKEAGREAEAVEAWRLANYWAQQRAG